MAAGGGVVLRVYGGVAEWSALIDYHSIDYT